MIVSAACRAGDSVRPSRSGAPGSTGTASSRRGAFGRASCSSRTSGRPLTKAQARERYSDDDGDDPYTLLFHLGGDRYIDAAVDGNDARFINHSCDPNCDPEVLDGAIWIRAIRNIQPESS